MSATTYAFRDSPLAEARLELLSEIFDPATAAFLLDWAPRAPRVAVDLGCGPGFTTRLLGDVVRPRRLLGVDASAAFLASAQAHVPAAELLEQDLNAPLALDERPDLLFCRLLLGHLDDPLATIERWRGVLAPGGRLLIDEVEAVDTDDPAFASYLELVRAVLEARGHRMEMGPLLSSRMPGGAIHSQLVRVAPAPVRAARMFRLNLAAFGEGALEPERARALDAALAAARGRVEWQLRQLVIERRNPR